MIYLMNLLVSLSWAAPVDYYSVQWGPTLQNRIALAQVAIDGQMVWRLSEEIGASLPRRRVLGPETARALMADLDKAIVPPAQSVTETLLPCASRIKITQKQKPPQIVRWHCYDGYSVAQSKGFGLWVQRIEELF